MPGNKEDVTKLWGKVIKLDEEDGIDRHTYAHTMIVSTQAGTAGP